VPCTNRCPWCDDEEETNWHAFVGCDVARESWFSDGLSVLIAVKHISAHAGAYFLYLSQGEC